MAATSTGMKEFTGTAPVTLIIGYRMVAMIAGKNNLKLLKLNPITFLCVTFSFLHFSDHSIVHGTLFLSKGGI
jgi:hypothetical protein